MPMKREPAFTSVEEVLRFLTEEDPLWGRIEKTLKGQPYYTDKHRDENWIKKTVPKRIFEELLASGLIKIDEAIQHGHSKSMYIASSIDGHAALRERWRVIRARRAEAEQPAVERPTAVILPFRKKSAG